MAFTKKKKYSLQCEWSNCVQVIEDMEEFYKHLEDHFWTDFATVPLEPNSTVACQWCECNFASSNAQELLRHLYFHGFHTKLKWAGLLRHQAAKLNECQVRQNRNILPELPDGFQCCWDDCDANVDIPDKFYEHVREHALISDPEIAEDGKQTFRCRWQGCSYFYSIKNKPVSQGLYKLKDHMSTHTQERCFACPWCGNLYVNNSKLTDHFTRQINVENHSFQCTHCSRTFATERILKDHMRHHVNHYQCPNCAMTCPNPSALKHHIRYKHSTERPYACEFCEYRSKEPHDLQTHMQFHQSDLAFHCQVADCDYTVRSLQNLRYHYRVKHGSGDGKHYACHLCQKTYGIGYQLTHHLRKAHSFQWPPGHCRFRYKECEDGMYRLQTFRYESIELTKQLTLIKPTAENGQAVENENAGIDGAISYKNTQKSKNTRLNSVCKKFGVTIQQKPLSEDACKSVKSTLPVLRKSARQQSKLKTKVMSPRKTRLKRKRKTPVKKTQIVKKEKKAASKNQPEEVILNNKCLEAAAEALCNMKSNSEKKRQMESGTFDCTPASASGLLSTDMLDQNAQFPHSTTSGKEQLDYQFAVDTPSISENSLNKPTRISSMNVDKISHVRKRLQLATLKDIAETHGPLHDTVRNNQEDYISNGYHHGSSSEMMETSSSDVTIKGDAPVFPNYHKKFLKPLPQVQDESSSSAPNNPTCLQSFTMLSEVSTNLFHDFELERDAQENDVLECGTSGTCIIDSSKLSDSLTVNCKEDLYVAAQNSPSTYNDFSASDSPSAIPNMQSTTLIADVLPSNIHCDASYTTDSSKIGSGETALTDISKVQTDACCSKHVETFLCPGLLQSDQKEDPLIDMIGKNTEGKSVEVNGSHIVTDDEGHRTLVKVAGEDYYLVSGNDLATGSTIYCLVKTSEYAE